MLYLIDVFRLKELSFIVLFITPSKKYSDLLLLIGIENLFYKNR
jgi:hypothetical protein